MVKQETKAAIQCAAESCANDMDLDIPVDDNCKSAIRWLLTEAFLEGYEMNLNKISTKAELESELTEQKIKMDFVLRQAVEMVRSCGMAGLKQEINGYEVNIRIKEEKTLQS